jgi:two-component system chemotaxis response regulator CheB
VPDHDIIVIGTSAGGVEALSALAATLPHRLPAAVFVVLHLTPTAPSYLPQILNRAGTLSCSQAEDGERILPGRIYVAPPDRHLMLAREKVMVVRGPKENRHRPAVDPLFRSAALAYGPRVIGVILTGVLDDGTSGLLAVKRRGGVAVVQDPDDAYFPDMPASALEYVEVDYRVSLAEMGALLSRLVEEPAGEEGAEAMPKDLEMEELLEAIDPSTLDISGRPGNLVGFVCPECKGPLWEVREGALRHYRCRVGHSYTADSMLAGQGEAVEDALWTALNILQESAQLSRQLADEAQARGHRLVAQRMEERVRVKRQQIETLRDVLANGKVNALDGATTTSPGLHERAEESDGAATSTDQQEAGA